MIFDKGYSIKVDENRCLNQRHLGVECNHCRSHCQADAIILDQNRVYLNKENCNGCGLCLGDCPTQVFRSSQWDETSVIENVTKQDWRISEFFCAKHLSPYQADKTNDRGAIQLPACLSIVTRGAWYELGLQTQVELHLDQCGGCPMSKTLPRLELNIATASEWLAASGRKAEFSFIHSGSKGNVKKSLKAIEAGPKITSRRDLFLSLMNKGRQLTGQTSCSLQSPSGENDRANLHDFLPAWQKRLAEVYTKNMREGSSPAYWPVIKINNSCVHCGLCSLFCPTGALQCTIHNGVCTYSFTGGLCLDCRICELVCEHGAVSRDKDMVAKPFDSSTVYASPVVQCRRCGGAAAERSTSLCYWCSREKTIDNEFKKGLQKIFD